LKVAKANSKPAQISKNLKKPKNAKTIYLTNYERNSVDLTKNVPQRDDDDDDDDDESGDDVDDEDEFEEDTEEEKKISKKSKPTKAKKAKKPKKPNALTEDEINGKIENYAEQFSLDQLAQTNINLNNLTFQMLKERQSQMSSQQPCSSQQPSSPNSPAGTIGGKVNGFKTKTGSGVVINSKPNSRIANLSFSHTSTTTTAANVNTVVVDVNEIENQRPSKRSYNATTTATTAANVNNGLDDDEKENIPPPKRLYNTISRKEAVAATSS